MDLSSLPTPGGFTPSTSDDRLRPLDWPELRARLTAARLWRRATADTAATRRAGSFDPAAARRLAEAEQPNRGR